MSSLELRGSTIAALTIQLATLVVSYTRCGRTARAGARGTAISLLKGGQVSQFKQMRSLIEKPERVKATGVKKGLVRDAAGHYRSCVKALSRVLQAEEEGAIRKTDPIPTEYYPLN